MLVEDIALFVGEIRAHVVEIRSLLYEDVQVRLLPHYSF